MRQGSSGARLLAALACALAAFHAAWAAHAAIGTPVADGELATLQGGSARVLGDGTSVLVFFRPNQDRSATALRELAQCRARLSGRPVRWVGVVSDSVPAQAASALVREAGFDVPVLVDRGDALYGALGIALHPVVVIVGRDRKLAAFEPFRSVDFCAVVTARVRHALGEVGDAEVQAALEPPKSAEGGDEQVAARYRALAQMQLKSGSPDKALASIERSLEKAPKLAASHALRGEILAVLGRCSEAVPAFREALSLDASNVAAKAGLERCAAAR
jgi:tetratricopeptide (TPR) repeat protein